MNRAIAGLGLSIAVGAGVGAAIPFVGSHLFGETSPSNTEFARCAAVLGNIAVDSAVMPAECKPVDAYIPYTDITTITDNHSARNNVTESKNSYTIYHLPSAPEFRKEHLASPSQLASRWWRTEVPFVALGLFMGGTLGVGKIALSRVSKDEKSKPEPESEPASTN